MRVLCSLVAVLAVVLGAPPLQAQTLDGCTDPSTAFDTLLTGRQASVAWGIPTTTTLTDGTVVPVRVDGFNLEIRTAAGAVVPGFAKADIGKPTQVTCPGGTRWSYLYALGTGFAKNNYITSIWPWNFILDANGNPTTQRQEGTVRTRPFVVVDPVLTGPPPAVNGLKVGN